MNKATFKTIGEILTPPIGNRECTIVVPNYQRGYKWAVKYKNGSVCELSAIEKLLYDIRPYVEKKSDYFLQGITVLKRKENDDKNDDIILIDTRNR